MRLSSRLFYILHNSRYTVTTSTYDNIDNNQNTGMVTLDLTKAFDTVCPKRLLIKLDHYGIRGTAFKLMQSYLNIKFQYVYINNIESNQRSVIIRVPEGSVLGPLLFLIYRPTKLFEKYP